MIKILLLYGSTWSSSSSSSPYQANKACRPEFLIWSPLSNVAKTIMFQVCTLSYWNKIDNCNTQMDELQHDTLWWIRIKVIDLVDSMDCSKAWLWDSCKNFYFLVLATGRNLDGSKKNWLLHPGKVFIQVDITESIKKSVQFVLLFLYAELEQEERMHWDPILPPLTSSSGLKLLKNRTRCTGRKIEHSHCTRLAVQQK